MESPSEPVGGTPLLATKLYAPRWRPGFVSRPALIERLRRGAGRKLTLVSAAAGFGKTTLLAEWLATAAADGRSVAWVSLDAADNDPSRFWTYLLTALKRARPGVSGHALALLQSPQPPPIESILTNLINDLAAIDDEIALALDDYHAIETQSIHDALVFLLDHLPPSLQLIIATRADPPLPLARLRARAEVTELRAADLRFTSNETAAFFNERMGLGLSAVDIAILEGRTEGWIAGLQLAALSMHGHQDISEFIRAFAGDHRYIADYLVDEVLRRQPASIRDFLLQTAILDRLSGPLCDAVTGQREGAAQLETLERGNFFLVPLDDQRRWYRYHHLFADVLRAHLRAERPDAISALNRRASEWFERTGSMADAIRHALAAGDAARAADLIERVAPEMLQSRQEATVLRWLRTVPDDVIRCRPVLSNLYAGVLMQCGEFDGVEARLRDAERWLTRSDEMFTDEMVVVDHEAFRRLPGGIAVHRAGYALAQGDVAETMNHARRALDLIGDDDVIRRGSAAALLGLASWTSGDLEIAHRSYGDGMASLLKAGFIADTIGGTIALADIRIAQGRLGDALGTYQRALRLATERGTPTVRGTADLYVGMSEIARERNDLTVATQLLRRGVELGEHVGFPQFPYRWRVAMARIREVEGDGDGALALLDEAERRYTSDFYPNVRPISALKARIWVRQGRLDDALTWARESGLSVDDEPSFLGEFDQITLARLLLARARIDRGGRALHGATGLLARLLQAAIAGNRTGSAIEILVVQALVDHIQGDLAAALASLERALTLTEPEGYVRIFADEGAPMLELLRHAVTRGICPAYAARLVRAFDGSTGSASAPTSDLAEPLTAREIEILRLIAVGLRNQEIADRLFISPATVKRHIANAYGKLGAGHRTEALAKAAALNLL